MAKRIPIKVPDSSLSLTENLEVLSHWAATYDIRTDARQPLTVEIDYADPFFQVLEPLSEEIQAFGKAYQGSPGRAADEFQKLIQRNFRGSSLDSDTVRRLTGIATRLAVDTMARYNYAPQSVHEGVAYLLNGHFWDDLCSDSRNIPGFNSHYNAWRAHVLNSVHLVGTSGADGATLKFDSGVCDGGYYCANQEGKQDYTVHFDRLGMLSLSTQGASVLGNHEVFHAILTGDAVKYIQKWEPDWSAAAIHRRINCYEDVRVTAAGVNVTNDTKLRARHLYQAHSAFLVARMKSLDPKDPNLHSNECFYLSIKEGLGTTVPYQCQPEAEAWLAQNRNHILALADRQTIPVGSHGKMNYITRDARREECALAAAEHLHALVASDIQEQKKGGQGNEQSKEQGKDGQQGQNQPSQAKEPGQQSQSSQPSDEKEKGQSGQKPGDKDGQKNDDSNGKGQKSDKPESSDGEGAEKKEGDSSKDASGKDQKGGQQGQGNEESPDGQPQQGGEKNGQEGEGAQEGDGKEQSQGGSQAGGERDKGAAGEGQEPGDGAGKPGSSKGQPGSKGGQESGEQGEGQGEASGQPKAGGKQGEAGGKQTGGSEGQAGGKAGQDGQEGDSSAGSPTQNGASGSAAGSGSPQGAGTPGVGGGDAKPGDKGQQAPAQGAAPQKDAGKPGANGSKPADPDKPRRTWGDAPKEEKSSEPTAVGKAAEAQKKLHEQQQNSPADLTPPPPADKPLPEVSHEIIVFEKAYIHSPLETLEREHGGTIREMTRLYQESMRNAKAQIPKPEARISGDRLNMPGYLRQTHIEPEYEKIYERKPKDIMESEYTFHLVMDSSGSMYCGNPPTIKPATILMSIQMLALLGAGHRSSLSAFAEHGEGMIPVVRTAAEAAPFLKTVLARAMDGQHIHQGRNMGGGTEIYYSLRAPMEIIKQTKEITGPQAITVFSDGGVANQYSSSTETLIRHCKQAKIPLIYACYPQVPPSISDIVGEQCCVALPDLSLASCKKVHSILLETMKRNKLLVDVQEGKRVIQEVKRLKYSPDLQAGQIPVWKGQGR